jgi:hypothetical protein
MARYFVGFLLAVGLIVVVVVLIIRGLLTPHKAPTALDLPSYAETDTKVQLTIDTPVTDPDHHNDVVMTIGNTASSLMVTKGYDGDTVRIKTYPMTTSAYEVFLRALNYNGFTKGSNDPSLKDERGHCATGQRYIYQIIDGSGSDLQRYWHSSCGQGTFGGNVDIIRHLFMTQFPDFSTQTNDIQL